MQSALVTFSRQENKVEEAKTKFSMTTQKLSPQTHTVRIWFLCNRKVIPLIHCDLCSFGLSSSMLLGQFTVRRQVADYFSKSISYTESIVGSRHIHRKLSLR